MRSMFHPAREHLSLTDVLYALSDPVRLRVAQQLALQTALRPCGELGIPIPKPTLSHHLKVLRQAGIVSVRVEGTTRLYALRRPDLEERFPGLLDSVLRSLPPPGSGETFPGESAAHRDEHRAAPELAGSH
ncbi:MAG TPA: metalloregulator ArsR/SmtB family transcription factor [Dehalococcoidia bacterium]|nr:metalloregulator ArsR/SmtB family transcription factor [Dehalococcoidia bacterium]